MYSNRTIAALGLALAAFIAVGCGDDGPPGETYFDRNIQPILNRSCVGNTGGCHAPNTNDPFEFVAGNLDVTSFEAIQKRPDVLRTFGPYPVPLLLVKGVGNTGELGFNYDGEFRPLEVEHVGGSILQVGDDAYLTLLEWLENGATENGLRPPPPPTEGTGACTSEVPADFESDVILAAEQFSDFENNVQPILQSCNDGNCHGAAAGDFYISCGDTDRQKAWNYAQVQAFVDDPVDNSQILNVPLAVNEGGLFHSGGEHFDSRSDSDYQTLRDWAESVGRVEFGEGDPGKTFFRQHVQPILIQRGCSFEACHSPAATNDMKLRSGSQGFFASVALERNYKILTEDFLALEVPDARRGRAVAKTILRRFGGLAHRGGPVLETPNSGGADPANCDPVYDPATASAFCTVQEWIDIERQALIDAGRADSLAAGETVSMVYVQRNNTTDVATQLEFDTYQPDSDLVAVDLTINGDGSLALSGGGTDPAGSNLRSLIDGCAGVAGADRTNVDVSSPDVSPDGARVTFSLRTGAGSARQVFVADMPNGGNCTQVTPSEAAVGGIAIHNFDPAWSPEGDYIIFASTRGSAGTPSPSLSRQLFLPQSDIFRIRPNGSGLEQMTFLTNSEINPQTMREGRVIMTTEKVSRGFYQLAGRRINWDLTDYHPLLGQRASSRFADPGDPDATLPSVGYSQVLDLREGFNGNFIFVLADPGTAAGAGTLARFNRSVGTFEAGRGDDDPGYLESMEIIDPAATGRVGSATSGAYRSPFPTLADGFIVSYSAFSGDLGAATDLDFDIHTIEPDEGPVPLVVAPGQQLEAVLAIRKPFGENYYNFRQLVFGGGVDTDVTGGAEYGVIHFPDAPLIFTLLNANLRRGRPVELFRDATRVAVYQEMPASSAGANTDEGIYEDRQLLGTAPLAGDGSAKVRVPAGVGIILELQDDSGNPVVTMAEEHQLGPGEFVSIGVVEELFDQICGGCHGTISGRETDVSVTPDVLTGASRSESQNVDPATF